MTEQYNAHSPLPWNNSDEFRKPRILAQDGRTVATLNSDFGPYDENGICRGLSHNGVMANAAFIVTACNQFYENKARISELENEIAWLEQCLTDIVAYSGIWDYDEIEDAARAALSKAKEAAQ